MNIYGPPGDGGVIGGLNGTWEITITLVGVTNVDSWYFLNGPSSINPDKIPLDMINGLVITAVPEPTTMILLGSGLIGLAGLRRTHRTVQLQQ